MKSTKFYISILVLFTAVSCVDLNLNPLSEGSSSNWYSSEDEINMSLNNLYNIDLWSIDLEHMTDNWCYRNSNHGIWGSTINSQYSISLGRWQNCYKLIARANSIIDGVGRNDEISDNIKNKYFAEARFVRASQYAILISHFGDVPFYTSSLDIDEYYQLSQTDKDVILKTIYDDFDFAGEHLDIEYSSSELQRATKGAALALKARIALYMSDWEIAKNAAKACMDLGVYKLHDDYGDLFLSKTKNADESIFVHPRSVEAGKPFADASRIRTRNAGGIAAHNPTWDLFSAYECIDGLPIDESPLYNPRKPFDNRDPRCAMTIVEFGTPHLGYIYEPHPDSIQVLNLSTGKYQKNNDTRSVIQWASFNALVWKKGVDETWKTGTDPDQIYVRYAEVLLTYAEAKIELNEIDESVLHALNSIRARAYGVSIDDVENYPEIVETNQIEIRKKLRYERRIELAYEGIRYMDLMRWRLAEKALNIDNYGMLDPDELRAKVVNQGLWFFPGIPEIDEDGLSDFSEMYEQGLIKLLSKRVFDKEKAYLWPIPSKEILINPNLVQNPGY